MDGQIGERMRLGEPFGFESTWSGRSRPEVVRNAGEQGYETHGILLGTAHAALNVARVRRRVLEGGHRVPGEEIVRRWTTAFENLLAMWNVFDRIHVLDSSADTVRLMARKEAGGGAHACAQEGDAGLGGANRGSRRDRSREPERVSGEPGGGRARVSAPPSLLPPLRPGAEPASSGA